jgi:hypothetical protein
MKSTPKGWNKVLAQLGFRRRTRKLASKWRYGRRPLFESLEPRQMMAADTYTVTTLSDVAVAGTTTDDLWSLREALAHSQADGGAEVDTIDFDATLSDQTLTLSLGQLNVNSHVSITGLGTDDLTISGNNASRVFNIGAGYDVTVEDLTITGGKTTGSSHGAGIYSAGNLTLDHVKVIGNHAHDSGWGGAVYARVVDCCQFFI